MARSIIRDKSLAFALEIIAVYSKPQAEREYVLSKQLLRSGTSIGANVEEAMAAQSRNDFLAKMSVASKEARETRYWLVLRQQSQLTQIELAPLLNEIEALIRILTSIVKTAAETRERTQNPKPKTQNPRAARPD